ncbi:putative defense protein Hdd11 [Protopterus annectens]|uniref:putative defense protein Hdd11 n=1 Tax=Protopterus annectens TaxID=7888 RepID=UPI001CFB0062|nr:putative defense protein Hdd11 [Protopterus annectens]
MKFGCPLSVILYADLMASSDIWKTVLPICLLASLNAGWCYLTGAPEDTCSDMMPEHGVAAQTTASPYKLVANASTYIPGHPVQVQVITTSADFKGLLLLAKDSNAVVQGSWIKYIQETKAISCTNKDGAVTHYTNSNKPNGSTFVWMPPSSRCPTKLTFQATVVQNKATFWKGIKSSELTLGNATLCSSSMKIAPGFGILTLLLYYLFVN